MIGELATDFLTKLRSVPALATKVSLTIGGHKNDPNLLQAPLPIAWATLKLDTPDQDNYTHGPTSGLIAPQQTCMSTWAVLLMVPYKSNGDDDLIATQFPLLDAVRDAVHGTDTVSGYRWRYVGFKLALVYDDRLGYEIRFTVDYVSNSSMPS